MNFVLNVSFCSLCHCVGERVGLLVVEGKWMIVDT